MDGGGEDGGGEDEGGGEEGGGEEEAGGEDGEDEVATVTSSKPADANPVCTPIRPEAATELVPAPTTAPSTLPVIVDPLTDRLSAYQLPVATVRDTDPSTVTLPLFTACNCACPGNNASR